MSRMSDSMRNMASSWMLKNREPEFQEMAEFTKTFREKMVALESVSDKIAKDRFGADISVLVLFVFFAMLLAAPFLKVQKAKKKKQIEHFFQFHFICSAIGTSFTVKDLWSWSQVIYQLTKCKLYFFVYKITEYFYL